ncbi:OmpP1/FadL family transporter [Inhella gelatinilytica]|uniref:Transporter n=1 Tax=Inhella gelatinilytica TaxID=2795030 RepID=A0A931NBK8_9BURK|nr:outer membrane protein transport protein [Inhella gelatinilytica]MBH9553683.1 transporter [Inhella gelatinilytica]
MRAFSKAPTPLLSGLTLAALTLLCPAVTHASGYRFGTQSAAAEGTANANGAEAADASTLFANSAGLLRLQRGWHVSSVLDVVDPKLRFVDAGSYLNGPNGSGLMPRTLSQPGATENPADKAYVPHLYAAYKASDSLAYGIGMFVPWGAKLDYSDQWGGRYNIRHVELKSIALNPTIAYKATEDLSVSGGLVFQYMEGKIERAVPYGTAYALGLLAAARQAAASGAQAYALQLQQQAAQVFGNAAFDGAVKVEGKDWGVGFNLALLWEPVKDQTRIGVTYRSSVGQALKGSGDWTQPSTLPAQVLAAITAAPYDGLGKLDHNDSGAQVRVRTPESLSLQVYQRVTPTVAVMADATWMKQSRLEQLRIDFDSSTPDSISPEHWKDTLRLALGANWQLTNELMLRAGVANERSPVPAHTRSPVLPDSHRTWATLGANWKFNGSTSVDLALGQIKLKDAAMDITDNAEGETPCNCSNATVRGNYTAKANFIGLQLNHKF